MDEFDNPYVSPSNDNPELAPIDMDSDEQVDPRRIGKARHVPTIAILMIVHGVLMFLAGFGLIGMIVFITPQLGKQIEQQFDAQREQNPNLPQMTPEATVLLLKAVYGGMAAALFLIGILGIVAGIRNYGYRNRVLGVISLVVNMGSILFCWCLPASLGLLIFGLIIYLSPEADRAFQWQSRQLKQI